MAMHSVQTYKSTNIMPKKKQITGIFALALAGAFSAQAGPATISYDWTLTGSSVGTASGTLSINVNALGPDYMNSEISLAGSDYTVTAFSGMAGGQPVSLISGVLDLSTYSAPADPSGDLDGVDISFDFGSSYTGAIKGHTEGAYEFTSSSSLSKDAGTDTLTITAPEPTTLALSGLGIAGMLAARRRK